MAEPIAIDGLKDFGRDLKRLNADLPKAVRLALNDASDLVVKGAKPKFPTMRGRASGSLKAASTRTLARVSLGGGRAPHAPWLDFGGSVGRRQSVKRPFKKDGRYVYPTYRKLRDSGDIAEVLSDSLVEVARQAGIEVT